MHVGMKIIQSSRQLVDICRLAARVGGKKAAVANVFRLMPVSLAEIR